MKRYAVGGSCLFSVDAESEQEARELLNTLVKGVKGALPQGVGVFPNEEVNCVGRLRIVVCP